MCVVLRVLAAEFQGLIVHSGSADAAVRSAVQTEESRRMIGPQSRPHWLFVVGETSSCLLAV